MKLTIITLFLILIYSGVYSQSSINYQTGSGVVVGAGADVCADTLMLAGSFNGPGTICGGSPFELNLTAYLEGFYDPLTETMNPDTVTVYLRNATAPFAIADSSKWILNSSGKGKFFFANINNLSAYYLVVKHRNSIETWSDSARAFTDLDLDHDFTMAITSAYGNNLKVVNSNPVEFGIYSGDVINDGLVNLNDIVKVFNDSKDFVTGYVNSDVNGDNIVNLKDLTITYNNSLNFVMKKTP